ncbi:MAG: GIY-YIG nuclease family protein [Alistipes putredinis]|nr:MAG: GIY-YIG nuclease family protein [Alistipes putredinis]
MARLPLLPGVYRFFDKNGTVIYVGKAKSLRKRVSSYFVDSRDHSIKVRVMVRHIVDIKHIVVDSESDALLLENSLIKSLQPRYNVLLKDDKTYPWIAVTAERFPRIISQRRVLHDGTVYFGPYASVGMQHALLDLLHGLYPIRTCALNLSQENIDRGKYRPCLQYHIHKCKAPCAGYQSQQDYDEMITLVKSILRGDLRSTRQWLEEQMMQAASQMLFEEAERYRQKLEQLENYSSKSVIVSSKIGDLDVFSLLVDEDTAYCNFVRIVSGSVVNTFTVPLSTGVEQG